MVDQNIIISSPAEYNIKITKWKVREGFSVNSSQVILLYEICDSDDNEIKRLKSSKSGVVKKRLYKDGATVEKGSPLLELAECIHTTVIKDMCADCGADLRQNENGNTSEASVPMVHSVPELKVTQKLAQKLGQADTKRLLEDKKLVLLVDLDQTVIHTTNDNVPNNISAIYHFQLYGPSSPWYHTRLRPGTSEFLHNISSFFELHICTFGARNYAHTIAQLLDPDGKFFSHRILSRDECFNATSKTDNLKALFPCGDSMVCIIDDREDVWNMASNLIQVKPYHFFQHTGDINAPPGLSKHELDGKGLDFKDLTDMVDDSDKKKETKDDTKEIEKGSKDTVKKSEIDVKETKDDAKETKDNVKETTEHKNINKNEKQEEKSIESVEKLKEISKKNLDNSNSENIKKDDNNKPKNESNKTEDDIEIIEIKEQQTETDTKMEVKKKSIKDSIEELKITSNINIKDPSKNLIDIEDPDDYLLYLETILKAIHSRFYSIYDKTKELPDLKVLIPKIRSEVLRDQILVFSGLVPNHMKVEQSRAYMIARSLGANVSNQLTDKTTHLVAVTSGTFKVIAARKRTDVHIVTPDWLWCCAERWEHVSEKLFPLDPHKPSKMRQPPAHCHSPEHVVNYNEKSEISSSQPEPKFIDTINPLLSFSNADLAEMNQEFDQFFESDSSSDDEPVNIENPPINKSLRKRKRQEQEEERQRQFFSRTNENAFIVDEDKSPEKETQSSENDEEDEPPSAKFRRGEGLPSDLDVGSGSDTNGSANPIDEDDGDWNMMGAALEREFLGLE